MKALLFRKYGGPEVLQLAETTTPLPGKHQVRMRVYASSVNSWDWDMVSGTPYLYRLMFGLFRPRVNTPGIDIAGVVDAVGEGVTRFRVGEAVFGDISESWGGWAEYCCTPEKNLRHKPAGISFEEAAALPHAGVLAWQALYDHGPVSPGMHILINGAGGGVGTLALQLARAAGAHVTVVDGAAKAELLTGLGADVFLDYRKTDFTQEKKRYDLIIDPVANRPLRRYLRVLGPKGRLVVVGGRISSLLQTAFLGTLISRTGDKKAGLLFHQPNTGLEELLSHFAAGTLRPVIDSVSPLEEAPAALGKLASGNVLGKAVIRVYAGN